MPTPLELATTIAQAMDAKKAEDILVLDLESKSDVTSFFVIGTAANGRLAQAVAEEVEERVRNRYHEKPLATEGQQGMRWLLIDYGSVIVHIFLPEAREYYRLENLWGDADRIAFEEGDEAIRTAAEIELLERDDNLPGDVEKP